MCIGKLLRGSWLEVRGSVDKWRRGSTPERETGPVPPQIALHPTNLPHLSAGFPQTRPGSCGFSRSIPRLCICNRTLSSFRFQQLPFSFQVALVPWEAGQPIRRPPYSYMSRIGSHRHPRSRSPTARPRQRCRARQQCDPPDFLNKNITNLLDLGCPCPSWFLFLLLLVRPACVGLHRSTPQLANPDSPPAAHTIGSAGKPSRLTACRSGRQQTLMHGCPAQCPLR
jgi:hypothetical protein